MLLVKISSSSAPKCFLVIISNLKIAVDDVRLKRSKMLKFQKLEKDF